MFDSSNIRSVTLLCDKCAHTISYEDSELNSASKVESLKQLLRTSYEPLSDEAVIALDRRAKELQHEADRLAVEASRLRNILSELDNARGHLQESIIHMKGLPAPIRRLPIDVLGEIFSFAVDSEATQSGGYSFLVEDYSGRFECKLPLQTLRLSQVCHLWRHITTSSPHLWSFDKWAILLAVRSEAGVINLISHYLEMSRPLPLSLQLLTRYSAAPELLHVVFSHSARLRYVRIVITPTLLRVIKDCLQSLGPRPIDGYFPNLEEADLRNSDRLFDGSRTFTVNSVLATDIFACTPKLRSLTIDRFPPEPSKAFPYTQLQELTLGSFNELTDWEALSKLELKKLVLLRDNAWPCLQWPSSAISPVLCRSIAVLHIRIDTDRIDCRAALAMLFSVLILPSLETLHLSTDKGCEIGPPAFKSLIPRPLWYLKELSIDWQFIPSQDLYELFQLVPGLTKLTYRCLPSSLADLADLLTVRKDLDVSSSTATRRVAVLLPALLHLDIGTAVYDQTMDAISVMMASRWTGQSASDSEVVSLESMTLAYRVARNQNLHIPYVMQALCDAGFPLKLQRVYLPAWSK